ncbi:extracellular calcium-sensing receptor-like [Aquarana catesbeiana]|uniref:extracellular calcium-sensing receptor-like n=1 Tax=Aquarana catesbeiana TaxID=8400 RepID=UPI003CC9D24C
MDCSPKPRYYRYLLAFTFAIDEINSNSDILPNVTLGYHTTDSCTHADKAVESVLHILSGPAYLVPNYSCQDHDNLVGVIGDHSSETSLHIAEILNIYGYGQVSRHTDLAFEDMGELSDPMSKSLDSRLRKSWNSSLVNLKPAMAATVVARNMEYWLTQIRAHIEAGTPKEMILTSFPMLLKGVAHIADALAESVRMSSRSAALTNSARKALWLKTWQGDSASKVKLCGIPLTGDLSFRPGLEAILDQTADKKKAFAIERKYEEKTKRKSHPQRKFEAPKPDQQKKPSGKFRFILNLKPLNVSVTYRRFQMDYSVKAFLPSNCFMALIDLKDAYLHIPVAEGYQKFLRAVVPGSTGDKRYPRKIGMALEPAEIQLSSIPIGHLLGLRVGFNKAEGLPSLREDPEGGQGNVIAPGQPSGLYKGSCHKCPEDQWPNDHNKCVMKSMEYLSYNNDTMALLVSILSAMCFLKTTIIFAIFIIFQDSPIVRGNNKNLSLILLVSIMLSFLCVFLFLGHPVCVSCMLRQTSFGIIFTVAISSLLAKTIMVYSAFKATKPRSSWRKLIGVKRSYCLVLICLAIQIIINVIWLLISPPFPESNVYLYVDKIIIQCNEGSMVAFSILLGYMGLLSVISFFVAFLARNLPDSFNEAKYITFSMLVFCSVWVAFIPAYMSSTGKNTVLVEIFAILCSSAGILVCIFIPKCYIILVRPDLNSRTNLRLKTHSRHIDSSLNQYN